MMTTNIDPSQDRDHDRFNPERLRKLASGALARHGVWYWAGWTGLAGLLFLAILFVYCAILFRSLAPIMALTPKSQPSTIYSDLFVVQKGAIYDNTFLIERLGNLQISPEKADATTVQWKARSFNCPSTVLPSDSPLRTAPGQTIKVAIKEGRIDAITVDDKDVDAVALEPTPVALMAGSTRSISNYTKLDDIPTPLLKAFIAIEDQRFLDHIGFDPRGIARAIWVNIRNRSASQGASTLTQQLVKNLLDSKQKTIFRKLRELILALLIEMKYSKEFILEKYLNEVYVGQVGALEVHGVAEAARYFFGKPLEKLNIAEMAVIAGIVRGPAYYSPYKHPERVLDRKNTVLHKMEELNLITPEELKLALSMSVNFVAPSMANNKAPYFVDYVKAQVLDLLKDRFAAEDFSGAGLKIYTTIDLPLQRRADTAVSTTVRELEARYKIERPLRLEGILVAADHKTGFVRALVGGRSYAETTFNRVLNMKRQVGSTFKPIAYLAAFLKGKDTNGLAYSPAYMVDDEPWTLTFGKGANEKKWSPKNYESDKYRGHITLREAFANSINIPMAKIGVDVGLDRVVDVAHKLGIDEPMMAVPSLSLGTMDIRPLEMLQVYSTFANRGERVEITTVRTVLDERGAELKTVTPRTEKVFDPAVIDLLDDLLRTVVKEGTAKSMPAWGYSKTARGKTGTTSFSRDAWFAGFSQGLVAVTWTGFDELKIPGEDDEQGAELFKSPAPLTGAGSALPTWARFFAAAKPATLEDADPQLDSSIEKIKIDRTTGMRARSSCPAEVVYDEIFLPGTAPNQDCAAHP